MIALGAAAPPPHPAPPTQERLQALLTWFCGDFGGRQAECPTNVQIAERLGLPTRTGASRLIDRAAAEGLLRLTPRGTGGFRLVQMLPAGIKAAARQRPAPFRVESFATWLIAAARGDRMVYCYGHLAEARSRSPQNTSEAAALANAEEAVRAARSGLVILACRRAGAAFEYIAIRSAAPGQI